MALKKYQLDQETLKLLNILESSEDDDRRRSAIFSLAKQGGMNSARILIETFERTMWRSTKFLIIQALGQVQHERATEFLCQTAMGIDDFAMAAEAVLALGHTDDPVAGEFLANITNSSDHPLLRESLSALANMNYFPCQHELSDFLGEKGTDVPTSVFQNAVIAAGLRGYSKFLGTIQNILQRESSGPIFNTTVMALGRIGNDESAKLLEQLDTRYRAFAHQLKLAALEHIRLRLSLTIEDAVSAALTANSPRSIRQAWQVLATFPEDARKEAIHLLAGDAPCAFRAMERLVFFNKKSLFDDLKFLAENSGSLSKELFAGIARQHVLVHSRDEFLKAALTHGAPFLIRLLNYVRIEKADDLLFEILSNDQISKDLKFSAVNALVAQSLMLGVKFIAIQPLAMDFRTSYGKRLVRLIESEQDDALKARLLRAIGQIHYLGPDAANLLRDILKTPSQVTDAAYSALALCNSEEATKIISKRLRQIIASDDHRNEVASAIRGLARCDLVSDASCLVQISHDTKNNLKPSILKILCGASVPELTDFVGQCLAETDFQNRILAIVAAKRHHSPDIWNQIFNLLQHPNTCIAGRALDTITTSGGGVEHTRLFNKLTEHFTDRSFCQKVFRSLTPKVNDSYQDILLILDRLIAERPGALADEEMLQSAVNLRDNLLVINVVHRPPMDSQIKGGLNGKEKHAIDATLTRDLRGYSRYSEVIKSVLRSGEVTWQHPELFDARVDKSTVLVQYVKSVDLLLQEKIGAQMFLGQGADFLQKMQSRVVRLELDDDSGFGPDLVTNLDCSLYFSRDSFPAHKLSLICRSVMTGLIMKEQYKVVDGLRAWALLLLIFGRSFKFRGQPIDPLFPISKPQSDSISRIARAMNDLQDERNRAAHRGTILEMRNMQEMRALCAALLNDLDAHLHGT